MTKTINIALASDQGYFCGLYVTACSIAKNAGEKINLSFYILDGGINDNNWKLLIQKIFTLHKQSKIERFIINDEMFSEYPDWHGNKMAYARLILPDLLTNVDWCIYCDVDFLWLCDISQLWNECDKHYALIGTKDGTDSTLEKEKLWFERNNYQFDPNKYFCSGLCLFNLKLFRELNLVHKIEEILKNHSDIQYPDQAALNIVTYGKTKLVSQKWQRFPEKVSQDDLDQGCVIHHAGEIPWKRIKGNVRILSDTIMLWHYFNAEILGTTVWKSLRRYNSATGIIYHRSLFWIMRCPIVSWPLKMLCKAINHPGVYAFLECRSRRLIYRSKK